ncbi:Sec-independent protein translocase protein TatB [Roseixanthobacter pseudopolyaromaticivorans]|uniref:Sec-independent protein translocase protein TatB n=1 Tax=Xanthobacteraceae TaxID=335928 RepID=UPI00372B0F98
MFDIGWSELMLIGVVALIVIGPKELPSVLRTVGRTVTKLRRMAGEFQGQFQDALREADLSDMRSEIGNITESAKSSFPGSEVFDPLRSIREEIRSTVEGTAKPAAPVDLSPLDPPAVTKTLSPHEAAAMSAAAAITAATAQIVVPVAPVQAAPTLAVSSEPLVPLPPPAAEPDLLAPPVEAVALPAPSSDPDGTRTEGPRA